MGDVSPMSPLVPINSLGLVTCQSLPSVPRLIPVQTVGLIQRSRFMQHQGNNYAQQGPMATAITSKIIMVVEYSLVGYYYCTSTPGMRYGFLRK